MMRGAHQQGNSNSNNHDDTYCATASAMPASGICPSGRCLSCPARLAQLLATSPAQAAGYYPQGCADGLGYAWAPCDPQALPAHAVWTGNSAVAGASRGCPWACGPLTLTWNGGAGCLPCFPYSSSSGKAAPCVSGQIVAACPTAGYAACMPCTGPLPGALQAWSSAAPYFVQCVADCEVGVSFRAPSEAGGGLTCTACTRSWWKCRGCTTRARRRCWRTSGCW